MPSFQDSALIFFIALLLFGPKKLPELAKQLGKLMGEFRRASNEFRMQMEDELRLSEQAEQQKKIAAMQTAAPAVPVLPEAELSNPTAEAAVADPDHVLGPNSPPTPSPLPIATAGELSIMPPDTGLPTGRSSLSALLDAVPHDPVPAAIDEHTGDANTTQEVQSISPSGVSMGTEEAPIHG